MSTSKSPEPLLVAALRWNTTFDKSATALPAHMENAAATAAQPSAVRPEKKCLIAPLLSCCEVHEVNLERSYSQSQPKSQLRIVFFSRIVDRLLFVQAAGAAFSDATGRGTC